MALKSDAVERHSSRAKILGHSVHCVGLGVDRLGVVVVVEKLGRWVGNVCPAKSFFDVASALACEASSWRIVPDSASQRSVSVECFIDNVPGPDLTGVMLGDGCDVGSQNFIQRCRVVLVILGASQYSFGNLLVPDKAVSADFHVVLRCRVDQLIAR